MAAGIPDRVSRWRCGGTDDDRGPADGDPGAAVGAGGGKVAVDGIEGGGDSAGGAKGEGGLMAERTGIFLRLERLVQGGWLRKLGDKELAVLLILEQAGNAEGITTVSQETIARYLGQSTKSVKRHMAALRGYQILEQMKGPSPGQNATWRIAIPASDTGDTRMSPDDNHGGHPHVPRSEDTRMSPELGNGGQNKPHRGTKTPPSGDTRMSPTSSFQVFKTSPIGETGDGDAPLFHEGETQKKSNPRAKSPTPEPPAPRPRDPLFDAVAAVFFCGEVTGTDRSRIARLANLFRQRGATPEELAIRTQRCRHQHPTWGTTPEAVEKHWVNLGGSNAIPEEKIILFCRKLNGEKHALSPEDQTLFENWAKTQGKSGGHNGR